MNSEREESQRRLPTGLASAEIYDFLYVDRPRISALYAQLFPQGVLTTVKTTAQQTFSDARNLGSDLKVIKAETKSTEGGSEGIEQVFDPTWSVPLEVLSRLQTSSLVHTSLREANLGSVVLAEGFLRVIDYASMRELWEPGLKMAMKKTPKGQKSPTASVSEILNFFKALPQSIHAQFLTNDGFLWASLHATYLQVPADDLTLKHGGSVFGRWKVLYILDAYADEGNPPDVSRWSGGDMANAVLSAMHGIRTTIGRPARWFGITPLMIFRIVNPPAQQETISDSTTIPTINPENA